MSDNNQNYTQQSERVQESFDKDTWLTNLQNSINTSYPQELKQNIIKRNFFIWKWK